MLRRNKTLPDWTDGIIHILIKVLVQFSRFSYRKKIVANPRKILVVKTHAIGDVLLITPSIVSLRRLFPKARFYALVGDWSRPVLENNPHLEKLISYDDDILFKYKIPAIFRLIRRIKKENFDWAFIFQPSLMVHLLILLSGIPYRIGFDNRGSGGTLNKPVPWAISEHKYVALKFMELTLAVGAKASPSNLEFYLLPEDSEFADLFFQDHGQVLEKGKTIIGICPGGGVNPRDRVVAKLWHIDKYVSLIEKLSHRIDARFIIFGSGEDQAYIQRLIRNSKPFEDKIVNACRMTNLRQMGALFKRCNLVITNDSAPLHITVALQVPTVSIFGPTNHTVLLPENPIHSAIQSSVDCSPCYHNSPFPGCTRVRCMEDISADNVVNLVLEHLRKTDDQHSYTCI